MTVSSECGCRMSNDDGRIAHPATAELDFGPAVRCIWPGESVGELALLQRRAFRTSTVIAGASALPASRRTSRASVSSTGCIAPAGSLAEGPDAPDSLYGQHADAQRHSLATISEVAALLPAPSGFADNEGHSSKDATSDDMQPGLMQKSEDGGAINDGAGNKPMAGPACEADDGVEVIMVTRALFDSAVTSVQAAQLEERLAFLCKFQVRLPARLCARHRLVITHAWSSLSTSEIGPSMLSCVLQCQGFLLVSLR